MRIAVFGMGYVGCVSAGCLADMGHEIIAVEPNQTKVTMLNESRSPIIEGGMDQVIAAAVQAGRLRATTDCAAAVRDSELALVCVGTPSHENGSINLGSVRRVCEEIGQALASKETYYTVVIRSTVIPGTVDEQLLPILEKFSGKRVGADFGLCMNPEFLREGTALKDFYDPPKTVIGEYDTQSGNALACLYQKLPGALVRTSLRVAEMVKYADNSFHALKIAFANEIGNIAKASGIDSHALMDIFCMDTKLNLSKYYLKPGFAFGGSCLPKDLRSITYHARQKDITVPVLNSILNSNDTQIEKIVNKLVSLKGKTLGFLGLSFKTGTDDLRESPIVSVIETMLGKGFQVKIHDRCVSLARLIGANKDYIEKEIPHLARLLCTSADELVAGSDVLIVASHDGVYYQALEGIDRTKQIIDLVRMYGPEKRETSEYYGICW